MQCRIQKLFFVVGVVAGLGLQASDRPQDPRKWSTADTTAYASQLITTIKTQLIPHINTLKKAGYTLEAIPFIMRDVIETTLQQASTDVVVALVNTMSKSNEKLWDPLLNHIMAFLLNKRFITYFGVVQRFAVWSGIVKGLSIVKAELIAEIFGLESRLYPVLLRQLEIRNQGKQQQYTFADFWLMGNEEYLRSKLGYLGASGWFSSSYSLTLNGVKNRFVGQLTSLVGLRLIDATTAYKISRISINNAHLDTIIPDELNHFPNLAWLELESNRISVVMPQSFMGLHKLQGIYLHKNNINDFSAELLQNFEGWLSIGSNPISVSKLEQLHRKLPNVTIDARRDFFGGVLRLDNRIWFSKKDAAEFAGWDQSR